MSIKIATFTGAVRQKRSYRIQNDGPKKFRRGVEKKDDPAAACGAEKIMAEENGGRDAISGAYTR